MMISGSLRRLANDKKAAFTSAVEPGDPRLIAAIEQELAGE
jgi:hypothetical protein